ncbi:ribonuclease HII [Tamlana nanhaiensis]|uniref:Ribonuclease HII n=1 Tax=Neotamlana nanhaiensis TaxID=1382798 RepID=A0A0D7VW01_9FLAO|nr:PQQ-binding-like beta-propeller repeat protein [Tamlana nanhaiensis]KJD31026.1 ribonuclease HII [Tamlana nanhaiensis]
MRFLFVALAALFFVSCNYNNSERTQLIDFVPENASVTIKSSNIEGLKNSIKNNEFLQELAISYDYKKLENKLKTIGYLTPKNEVLICLFNDATDSLQYSIITKLNTDFFVTDSLPNYSEESLKYNNKTIIKSTINDATFFSTIIDSTFYASSSKKTTEAVLNKPANLNFLKAYNALDKDNAFSVLVNTKAFNNKTLFINDALSLKNFSHYIAADFDVTQDAILVNGISSASDSTSSLINVFKNTIPQENLTKHIAPSNCDGFISITFDSFKTFNKNLSKYKTKDSIYNSNLFNDIVEIGVIYEAENRAIILNSIDVIATNDAIIDKQNTLDSYRGIDIFNFTEPKIFKNNLTPFVSAENISLYCTIDNFFVFSNNLETLQNIIASYQNKTTINDTHYFKSVNEKLSKASSFLQVINSATLQKIINKNESKSSSLNLNKYDATALQFVYDNNFAHVHAIIKKSKSIVHQNSISESFNIKLDKDILNEPQLVKNHITEEKEIVVQDINNNLYLISNQGKILWKKALQGPILGNIEQIDIYKNGRLQLAFTTPKRVYVVDRNGNDVGPFPAKFNDDITQPLSVFDYNKNKNYRLLVTQGKHVLLYNVQAKIVKGFNFTNANNPIISQPKHFRLGRKDYITFKTKNKLYILDRRGKTRVSPKVQENYANTPVFLYRDNFTTTTASGNLYTVDTKGNVAETPLNLGANHFIDASSKTLVTLSENLLTIKNKTTELDFGEYTSCKFFYLNDKIYISVTDLQAHKVYLFDSQSKLLANFPVYGNSSIALDNIDNDKNLEFVTKGESNSIIIYQIN